MLLDRKRIRKWAKWVALVLAIIFAVSFITMGVGYGSGGFNVFNAISCSEKTSTDTQQSKLDELLATIEADPTNTQAMLDVADIYEGMYDAGQGSDYLYEAAGYLQQAITADPNQKDVYLRLANLYVNKMAAITGDAIAGQQAASVLMDAIAIYPDDPDIWLKLGSAQRDAGNVDEAVLAWQRYLKLDPDGQYASLIQQQLDALTDGGTTTTAGTTTTNGSETTGAGTATTTLPADGGTMAAPTATSAVE